MVSKIRQRQHLCEKSQPLEDFARRVNKKNKYNFILWNKELYLSKITNCFPIASVCHSAPFLSCFLQFWEPTINNIPYY